MVRVLGILVALLVVVAGGVAWMVAVSSRKQYVCPSCGNSFVVEHMKASSCNVCGAPVRETT